MQVTAIEIGSVSIGGDGPLCVIAGPCVIEHPDACRALAEKVRSAAAAAGLPLIFKASFDKANRSSVRSYRGPGLTEGLAVLKSIGKDLGIPTLTDVHGPGQVGPAAEAVDVLQIPAFLCRQTDLLVEAGNSGRAVNIKKGQFMAPWDMRDALEKVTSTGNGRVILTERGTTFGYNNLVADMRALPVMRSFGMPVVFDGTHAVQLPGAAGGKSGGDRTMAPPLLRAAVAAGVDGVFIETHDDPASALSDGPNMIPIEELAELLARLKLIDEAVSDLK